MSVRNMLIGSAGASTPGAPTSVSATDNGNGTATVSFTAPTDNGGSTITSYTVYASSGGATATGSSSPITISTGSGSFSFTVAATNAIGTGPQSSSSSTISVTSALYTFTNVTFGNAGRQGRNGPSLGEAQSAMTGNPSPSTWYSSYFTVSSGLQIWTVPVNGMYRIQARGAQGGISPSGSGLRFTGATMQGDYYLVGGTQLKIIVGQSPGNDSTYTGTMQYAGAGCSAVMFNANNGPILFAGGAGGVGYGDTNASEGTQGLTGNSGATAGDGSTTQGRGGINGGGGGGGATGSGAGGAGLLGNGGGAANGTYCPSGGGAAGNAGPGGDASCGTFHPGTGGILISGPAQGGLSPSSSYSGGFGGGGAFVPWNSTGAGGGGYSGGGGAGYSNPTRSIQESGGGGGSYLHPAMTNTSSSAGGGSYSPGNQGFVTITKL